MEQYSDVRIDTRFSLIAPGAFDPEDNCDDPTSEEERAMRRAWAEHLKELFDPKRPIVLENPYASIPPEREHEFSLQPWGVSGPADLTHHADGSTDRKESFYDGFSQVIEGLDSGTTDRSVHEQRTEDDIHDSDDIWQSPLRRFAA